MTTRNSRIIRHVAEAIRSWAPASLRRAWVFGSCVKAGMSRARDVDIIVEAKPGFSLLEASGFKINLEEQIGRRVDMVSRRYIHPRLRREIERTKVLLYERD